jgi:predicted RNase H-like HicB family nuclease
MKLKVVIEPGEQFGFVVHVPAFPGCWSQGATREEAIANIREAAEGWLEVQQDRIDRTETPSKVELITL